MTQKGGGKKLPDTSHNCQKWIKLDMPIVKCVMFLIDLVYVHFFSARKEIKTKGDNEFHIMWRPRPNDAYHLP